MSSQLAFRILGPLEVVRDGRRVEPSSAKLRALLIALLVHRTQFRTGPQLIDDIWGDRPPTTAPGVLRNYLSQLRELLGPGVLIRHGAGYGIDVRPGELDSERFEELAAAARTAARGRDLAAVIDLTATALALWRGAALADVAAAEFTRPHVARLGELRDALTELRLEATIAAGRPHEAIAPLEELLVVDPLRERLWWLLMLAQYRCGRQADALRSYQRVRAELAGELGVDPGTELRELEVAILNQRPELDDLLPRAAAPAVEQPVTGVSRLLPPRRYRTALVGRAGELDALVGSVVAGAVLTLTGVGGAGKTRLAVALAERVRAGWSDGVAFLDLAPVGDDGMVAVAALVALGLDEEPARPPLDTVTRALRQRRMLLVVDNCEHVIEAAARLADAVVDAAPGCAVLATSRVPLAVPDERVWAVGPLAADDEGSDAVRLLVERAVAVNPGFRADHHAVELVRRLGGLPLAIEMVAPWTRTLSMSDIADRLDQLVAIGDDARPQRQQRMAAVFDWSDRRLDPATRRVFHRLGVFVGDFDLAAAEAVVPADAGERPGVLVALGRLVDHSLVIAETSGGPTRYRMLEPVRQFAAALLDGGGDGEPVRDRHGLHYRSIAIGVGRHAAGPAATEWLARADQETANLRAAHDRALRTRRADDAAVIAGGLYWYWWIRASSTEGIDRLRRSLDLRPSPGPRARARIGLASLLIQADRLDEAAEQAEAAVEDARLAGDARLEAHAVGTVGRIAGDRGRSDVAEEMLRDAQDRFEAWGNRGGTVWCLFVRYAVAARPGAQAAALPGLHRAHRLAIEEGTRWGQAWTTALLGLAALRDERFEAAVDLLTTANRLIDDNGLRDELAVYAKSYLGVARARTGRARTTTGVLGQALAIAEGFPDRKPLAAWRWALAEVAAATADPELVARSLGAAEPRVELVGCMTDTERIDALRATAAAKLGATRVEALYRAGEREPDHDLLAELEASLNRG
ncbi:BTAD domain-containing putative transcriptional regulator [Pseudonocardia sp. GCM10023141]|uniref:BTAD domain-containing putative transcriptional regulator n=1 Tax=Pseudonocardia sp. GCM10023141 TaxID=3252653 RepID=UPI00361F4740